MNGDAQKRLLKAAGLFGLASGALGLALACYACSLPYRLSRLQYKTLDLTTKVSTVSLMVGVAIGVLALSISKSHSMAGLEGKSAAEYKRILQLASLAIVVGLLGAAIWMLHDSVHSTAPDIMIQGANPQSPPVRTWPDAPALPVHRREGIRLSSRDVDPK